MTLTHSLFFIKADGYVIGSSIKHIPIAGRDLTYFVQQLLRDRGESSIIPPEDSLKVAEKIKENYSYVCGDMVKEFNKYDTDPGKFFSKYEGIHSVTGRVGFTFFSFIDALSFFILIPPISLFIMKRNTPSTLVTKDF